MRDNCFSAGLRILDAGGRQARHLDHDEVDVLRIGQARIGHRFVRGLCHLANLTHASNLFGRHRFGSGTTDDQALFSTCVDIFVGNLNPFTGDCRDVRRDHARAATRQDEDDFLGHVARRYAEEFASPFAQRHVRPDATPVVMKPSAFRLSDQGDESVGLDLS